MFKTYNYISLLFVILLFSCKKNNVPPIPILVNLTISSEYISHSSTDLKFRIRFAILDSRNNNQLTTMDIKDFLSISPEGNTESFYSFTLDTLFETVTPNKGNYSTAIMIDQSKIDESYFAEKGPRYLIGQETACRKFFKSVNSGSEFILAAYAQDNTYLPDQPLTIFSNSFTKNGEVYDQVLADLRRYNNLGGICPFISSTDSMLNFAKNKASNSNKQLVLFTHNYDNSGNTSWDSLINKSQAFNIPCNIIMTYQNEPNFVEYVKLACRTGGFIFYVENNQDGLNIPMFGEQLNNILIGNYRCFESVWTFHSSQANITSGSTITNYIELYMDNAEKIYTYIPFYIEIP